MKNMKSLLLVAVVVPPFLMFLGLQIYATPSSATAPQATRPVRSVTVHHFISQKNDCSKRLIRHLAERGRDHRVNEVIHLIDGEGETEMSLQRFGFEVESLNETMAVKKYGADLLPRLVVKREDETFYQGGYGAFEDAKIIGDVLQNHKPAGFPPSDCSQHPVASTGSDARGG